MLSFPMTRWMIASGVFVIDGIEIAPGHHARMFNVQAGDSPCKSRDSPGKPRDSQCKPRDFTAQAGGFTAPQTESPDALGGDMVSFAPSQVSN
jgi:hypothetical protein